MSIDQLKKRAKNLQKLYPEFAAKHATLPPKLTDFQELMARVDGYPSLHAATTRKAQPTAIPQGSNRIALLDFDLIGSRIVAAEDTRTFEEYRLDGTPKKPRVFDCVFFQPRDLIVHAKVTDALDAFLDASGYSGEGAPPPRYSIAMIDLCQAWVMEEPGFIDGYAHWANSLYWLERHQEVIALNQPVFDRLTGLVPAKFNGRIPYSIQRNRPFHRLVHTLVLSYWALNTPDGDASAITLAKKMLKWWPNDNIGFRYLLTRPPKDE